MLLFTVWKAEILGKARNSITFPQQTASWIIPYRQVKPKYRPMNRMLEGPLKGWKILGPGKATGPDHFLTGTNMRMYPGTKRKSLHRVWRAVKKMWLLVLCKFRVQFHHVGLSESEKRTTLGQISAQKHHFTYTRMKKGQDVTFVRLDEAGASEVHCTGHTFTHGRKFPLCSWARKCTSYVWQAEEKEILLRRGLQAEHIFTETTLLSILDPQIGLHTSLDGQNGKFRLWQGVRTETFRGWQSRASFHKLTLQCTFIQNIGHHRYCFVVFAPTRAGPEQLKSWRFQANIKQESTAIN